MFHKEKKENGYYVRENSINKRFYVVLTISMFDIGYVYWDTDLLFSLDFLGANNTYSYILILVLLRPEVSMERININWMDRKMAKFESG